MNEFLRNLLVEFEPSDVAFTVHVLQAKEPDLSQAHSLHHLRTAATSQVTAIVLIPLLYIIIIILIFKYLKYSLKEAASNRSL